MMLARMSGGDTSVPADFGVLVSQKNINDHLYMTMEKLTVWKQQQQKLYTMLKKATQHKNESIFETELKKIVPMAR
jgi:hypothetical protein